MYCNYLIVKYLSLYMYIYIYTRDSLQLQTPLNTNPYHILLTIRDIKKVYI